MPTTTSVELSVLWHCLRMARALKKKPTASSELTTVTVGHHILRTTRWPLRNIRKTSAKLSWKKKSSPMGLSVLHPRASRSRRRARAWRVPSRRSQRSSHRRIIVPLEICKRCSSNLRRVRSVASTYLRDRSLRLRIARCRRQWMLSLTSIVPSFKEKRC